jgi:ferredoxin
MAEIIANLDACKRILLVGCNECVTVCSAGGRKEVATLASALQMDFMKLGKTLEIREMTLERQ